MASHLRSLLVQQVRKEQIMRLPVADIQKASLQFANPPIQSHTNRRNEKLNFLPENTC